MNADREPITADVLAQACALFDRCVDLPSPEREALLDTERPAQPVATLLRSMLAADGRSGDPFETPAAVWAAQLHVDAEVVDELIGQSIADFEIIARLGQGGSSVVFAAERDVAGAKQRVALKLLRTGLFSNEARRRFRREQAILAQLTHPNIARLIDAGVSATGVPYIAMELVDGRPLLDDARARALDMPARLRLLAETALAVDAAHRALIAHRDLKPANILVDRDGRVKVLDFGIAKLLDDDDPTQTQHIALTPGYAPPEQYRQGAPTTAIDVYALGVIGAELVVDARLGPDARIQPGPDASAIRARWQSLDADLATLLRTALAEDPRQRYASARHLADDIGRYLAREPIAAHPPSRAYLARKFLARHRVGVAVGAAMLATLVVAFALVLAQRDLARQQAARADSMRNFMFAAFAEAEPGGERDGPATVLDAVRRAVAASDADPGADPQARLELRLRLAQVLQRQGDLGAARKLIEDVRQEAGERWGPTSALAMDAAIQRVGNSMAQGEFTQARAELDGLPPPTDDLREQAERLALSAVLASRVRDLERAQRDGAAAMALAHRSGDAELVRTTLNDWGVALLASDRFAEAIAAYEELLALNRLRFGERHIRVANVYAALARAYRRNGDLDRAETAARSAVEIDRAIYPGDDRHAAVNLNALMMVLRERGDLEAALPVAREALRINVATLGEGHPDTALARYGVADLLAMRGEYPEAVTLLAQTLADYEREFGAAHWRAAAARTAYGFALGMSGSMEAGVAELERAIDALRVLPDGDPDRLCGAIERRARLAQQAGDADAALQWLDRLQAADRDPPPTRACWLGNVDVRRAAVALEAGRYADADAALRRAKPLLAQLGGSNPLVRVEYALLQALLLDALGQPGAAAAEAERQLARLPSIPATLRKSAEALRERRRANDD